MESTNSTLGEPLSGKPKMLTHRILRYVIVGGASTVGYWVAVALCVEVLHLDPVLAAVLACGLVIASSYFFNRTWVFDSARRHGSALPRFLLATLISMLLNAGIMYFCVHLMGWWYLIGLIAVTAVVPPTNFLMNQYWCFRA